MGTFYKTRLTKFKEKEKNQKNKQKQTKEVYLHVQHLQNTWVA